MKKITILSVFITLSLLLSSCSVHLGLSKLLKGGSSGNGTPGADVKATHTPPAPVSVITIKGGKYRPKNVSVKIGTTLTFTNNDSTPQTVTSDTPGLFDSGPIAPGASWQYTFSKAGTFPYHSTAASGVFGSVTVTP